MTVPDRPGVRRLDPDLLLELDDRALLISRLRLRLMRDGKLLLACRKNTRHYAGLGDYYTVDAIGNYIVDRQVDVDAWARDLGIGGELEQ